MANPKIQKPIKKGNTMKTNIAIDPKENTMSISNAFYKKACLFGTPEYYVLRQAKIENPEMQIVFKSIRKKTYNGLTFKVMKSYIETQPNSEKQLKVFEAVKRIAEMKGSKYPLTKKWFLNAYTLIFWKDKETGSRDWLPVIFIRIHSTSEIVVVCSLMTSSRNLSFPTSHTTLLLSAISCKSSESNAALIIPVETFSFCPG